MPKRLLSLILVIAVLAGFAYGLKAQTLSPYAFTFTGKWNPSENPLLLDDYGLQDIQNLRKDGKHFKGVSGHTAINTTAASTAYPYILNGFHFKKDQPAESHVIIYSADSTTPTDGRLYQNTTAIPSTGDFSATALHTPTTFADMWRFSAAPGGNMVAANGDETLIWGGNEIEATAIYTSSSTVTYTVTNSNDYSDILSNTRQTSDQVATLAVSGGADSFVKLLLHCDGEDGSITFTDETGKVITRGDGAYINTAQAKFGTASLYLDGAGDYISTADHADWNFGTGNFTIDFWVRWEVDPGTANVPLYNQYADADHRVTLSLYSNRLYLSARDGAGAHLVQFYSAPFDPTAGTWYHIAFERVSAANAATGWRIFVNGTSQTLTLADGGWSNALPDVAGSLYFGALNPDYLNGWLDEVRVSKGIARWTSDFTVPNQPYGNNSNYFLVGSKRPLQGAKFYISSGNTATSTLTVKEWQGATWQSLTITDNTSSGGKTLATTGTVTWTYTGGAKPRYINGLSLYWYQFYFDAGQTSLYYVTTDAPIQTIRNIWDGIEGYVINCPKYDGTTYKDYTDSVGDSSQSTYADLSSLNTTHALYAGFLDPQQGLDVTFVAGSENGTATVLTVYYWNGASWAPTTAMNDATIAGGVSLSKGGTVSWQSPDKGTEFKRAISDEFPLYYYKLMWSAQLDADVKVSEIRGIPSPANISVFKFSETFQNRLFLFNEKSGLKNAAIYSNANAPDIFNGDDSGSVLFGDKTGLTAAKTIYNVFQNTAVEQMLVTKASETWRLAGNDPSTWELKRMSANIGCVVPLSMVSAEVTETTTDVRRSVAIWVSDKGPVMSDGAAIYPIYEDVKVYWDPNSSLYIPTAMQSKSMAWYDPASQSYKLLVASGTSATYLNTELEYSLKHKEWTKLYRENAAGANPLQSGWQVHDTSGLGYTYGGGKDGFMYRLENGNNWNSVANIAQYIHTKDLILDNESPLFRKSTAKYLRTAYKKKAAATGNLTVTHYGDRGSATVTGVSGQVAPAVITSVPTTHYNTQSVNLGPFLYHSFKFAQTTNAADGMELTGFGIYYEQQQTMR